MSFAQRPCWAELLSSGVDIFAVDYDAILAALYALSLSAEGDCYLCVLPDPSIEVAALGASESPLPGTTPVEALYTFTLDSGASHCFFRDSTTLTPIPAPVPVGLADLSRGPVLARSSTVLPCPTVLSGSLSGLHLPSFSTNMVSTAALQDAMVTTTTPGGASAQVSASSPVAPPCSCCLLSHQTLLWHHRLGHPSLPRLCGMHSRLLVSGLPRGAEPARAEPGGAEPAGVEPGGAESEGAESGGAVTGGAQPGGIEPKGAEPGGHAGASPRLSPRREPLSPQQMCEWFAQCTRFRSGAARAEGSATGGSGAGGTRATSLGGAGVIAGAGGTGGAGAAGPGGARTRGTGAAKAGGVGGAGAGDHVAGDPPAGGAGAGGPGVGDTGAGGTEAGGAGAGGLGVGDTGAGGTGAGGAGVGGTGPGGARAGGSGAGGPGAGGTGAGDPGAGGASTGGAGANDTGARGTPNSLLPAPSPYAEPTDSSSQRCEPASRPASLVRAVRTGRRCPRMCPPPVLGTHVMALRPSSVPLRVPLPSPPMSSLPGIPDPESDLARAASPTVPRLLATVVTDPSFESTGVSALVAELVDFVAACCLDYAASLVAESESECPPSIGGECDLGTDVLEDEQEDFECLAAAVPHLTAMDIEMASWKSTRTCVDAVPLSGANIVDGMWIFRVKRPPGSPPVFKARYVARGFSQREGVDFFHTFSPTPKMTTLWVLPHVAAQRDYELHSLDFSTAFLQGNQHEEIWLRHPSGFTRSFFAGTQWSQRPVYGLRQAPCEWHDTLRTTLAALGFAPSTADPSLFLRNDTSLPPFYVLVYVDDLVFATANTEALTLVKSELKKRHTCTDLVPPSGESVEPSGLYPELVGCLMYLMTCTRPDQAYLLSILARYVAPGRHRPEHWEAAKRVLRYLCSTSGMGLVLGGWGPVVLTGHADASWELRWLTYLLTDLGERPRSSPNLYVDNKAMIALCQEHRLEHKTKHITLRYFLARELQHRGQLRLAYVASRANTADIFTKALQSDLLHRTAHRPGRSVTQRPLQPINVPTTDFDISSV
ncbi:unnamed protein product, partial [Closterium sp. NIES-54]